MARFWHGTTSAGLDRIRSVQELRPADPAEIASWVAGELDLDGAELAASTRFAFSRDRHSDPHIYLSGQRQPATHYAEIGGEILRDALGAAFEIATRAEHRAIDGLPAAEFRAGYRALRQREDEFAATFLAERRIEPVVLEIELTDADLAYCPAYLSARSARPPAGYERVRSVAEWLELCGGAEGINTLIMPGPLPADRIIEAHLPLAV